MQTRLFLTGICFFFWLPAFADSSCDYLLTHLTHSDIQVRLNRRYRQEYGLLERLAHMKNFSLRLYRAFDLQDFGEFFPQGQLAPLAPWRALKIRRLSRTEGIQKIKAGVFLSEERAWIFVPALNVWIYNSVDFADANQVGHNYALAFLLMKEFGFIELFHTHPPLGAENIYSEHPQFALSGLSPAQFKLAAALPSFFDISLLQSLMIPQSQELYPRAMGYVVHEFGITSYTFRVFPYVDYFGKPDCVLPDMTTWSFTEVLKSNLRPENKIRKMLRLSQEGSTHNGPWGMDGGPWTPSTAPQLLLKYQKWKGLTINVD